MESIFFRFWFRFSSALFIAGASLQAGSAAAQLCNLSDQAIALEADQHITSAAFYGLANDIGRACAALKRAKPMVDQLNAEKCGYHALVISKYDRDDSQWGCSKVMKSPF